MKKATKALALLLAGTMVFGTVAGCGGSSDNGEAVDNGANSTETASKDNGATSSDGSIPLVYGTMPLSAKFSPFFANTSYDQAVVDLTQVGVLTEDRAGGIVYNGIEGETIPYNGTDYTYYGLSDVTVNKDDAANTTTYNIKIRDDVTFSDGEPLTIDDVIFTYYVMADTDFDGGATFGSQKILGMENYRANSTIASTISDDEVNAALKDMPEELAAQIQEGIVNPVLADETAWCADVYEAQGAASAEEFFVACYGKDESYSADGKDMETILADIQAQYGADYAALATNYAIDETYFDEDAFNIAKTYVIDQKKVSL